MSSRCPRCHGRSVRWHLAEHGVCRDCVRERHAVGRELHGAEREAVIREHLEWLGGRMPSEVIAQEASDRRHLALHTFIAARRQPPRGPSHSRH